MERNVRRKREGRSSKDRIHNAKLLLPIYSGCRSVVGGRPSKKMMSGKSNVVSLIKKYYLLFLSSLGNTFSPCVHVRRLSTYR